MTIILVNPQLDFSIWVHFVWQRLWCLSFDVFTFSMRYESTKELKTFISFSIKDISHERSYITTLYTPQKWLKQYLKGTTLLHHTWLLMTQRLLSIIINVHLTLKKPTDILAQKKHYQCRAENWRLDTSFIRWVSPWWMPFT